MLVVTACARYIVAQADFDDFPKIGDHFRDSYENVGAHVLVAFRRSRSVQEKFHSISMVGGDTRRVTQVDSDGTRYEGKACVSTGERQGRGTLRFPDGSFLSASFEQGVPHGQGSYTSAEGVRLEARFEYGALQGPVCRQYCVACVLYSQSFCSLSLSNLSFSVMSKVRNVLDIFIYFQDKECGVWQLFRYSRFV